MSMTTPRARSTSPSCVYVSAEPFFWDLFAGIPRYAARLALALARTTTGSLFLGLRGVGDTGRPRLVARPRSRTVGAHHLAG